MCGLRGVETDSGTYVHDGFIRVHVTQPTHLLPALRTPREHLVLLISSGILHGVTRVSRMSRVVGGVVRRRRRRRDPGGRHHGTLQLSAISQTGGLTFAPVVNKLSIRVLF